MEPQVGLPSESILKLYRAIGLKELLSLLGWKTYPQFYVGFNGKYQSVEIPHRSEFADNHKIAELLEPLGLGIEFHQVTYKSVIATIYETD